MKKIWKISLISLPIITSISILGIYFAISFWNNGHDNQKNNQNINSFYNFDKFNIFPKLSSYDFYFLIKIQNGRPIIDDDMISYIINYVIKKMNIAQGSIQWGYQKQKQNKVLFVFKWYSPNKIYTKKYLFFINNLDIN